MKRITMFLLAAAVSLLAGCGGGSSAPIAVAQAQTPAASAPADSTSQLQALLDSADGAVQLPAGTFYTSKPLVLSRPVHLWGAGTKATVIVSSADEAIVVAPEAGVSQGYFLKVHDLGIRPATPGTGRSAMVMRLKQGVFVSNFLIESVYFGDFGGPGLVLDNSVGNGDGFFTGTVRRCWITNGLQMIKVGDSINVEQNTITDGLSVRSAKAGGRIGIDVSSLPGARQIVLRENNITTSGGAIRAVNADQLRIENNQLEHPNYYGIPFTAPWPGFVQLTNVTRSRLTGNTISPAFAGAAYAVAIDGGELNLLDSNDMDVGTLGHLAFLGTTRNNKLVGLNLYRSMPSDLTGRITGAEKGVLP